MKKNLLPGVVVMAIIVPFLFFGAPKPSYAFGFPFKFLKSILGGAGIPGGTQIVSDPLLESKSIANDIRETVTKKIWAGLINMAIKKLTAQTVNWINSGFDGNPAFVTDPGKFFLGLGDTVASQFLSETNLNRLCSPFRVQVRLALVKNYLAETDNQNYSCTLSKIKNNYNEFMRDFSQGGWEGWFEVTQINSNNPYGSYLEAKTQLNENIDSQVAKYNQQLDWGRGFLSHEKCLGTEVTDVATGKKNCVGAKTTVTPGSVIENQLNTALNLAPNRLAVAQSVDQIISALTTEFVGRLANGLLDLSKQTGTGNSGRPFTSILQTISAEEMKNLISSVPENLKSPLPTAPNQPFIYLKGENPVNINDTEANGWEDPGAQAFDIHDGDISYKIVADPSVTSDGTVGMITYNITNSQGVSANEVIRTVNIKTTVPPPPPSGIINGACGIADSTYLPGTTSYLNTPPDYCSAGTPDQTPAFPPAGQSVTWICQGSNGGTDSLLCKATAQ